MRKLLFISLMITSKIVFAQSKQDLYQPIDQAGWLMTNLGQPSNLTVADTGRVSYLLKFSERGELKKIQVLSSTFSKKAERDWRKQVRSAVFSPQKAKLEMRYVGTLLIERQRCNTEDLETLNLEIPH